MTLIDLHWYALPDGTPVLARQNLLDGRFRLDRQDRQPLYTQDSGTAYGVWRRLVYDAAEDCYHVLPCDLVTEDLRLMEGKA